MRQEKCLRDEEVGTYKPKRQANLQPAVAIRRVPEKDGVLRILVIKLRHYGDVLLSTPVLSTLQANYPEAMIDVLVYKGTEVMLQGNKNVYLTLTVDRDLKYRSIKERWREEKILLNTLKTFHYDLVINLSEQWRAALYCRLLRPAFSLGFPHHKRHSQLWETCHSQLVPTTNHRLQHTVLNNLSILSPLAPDVQRMDVTLPSLRGNSHEVGRLCQQYNLTDYVLIHPGARWAFKTWTAEGFTEVVNHLTAGGRTVVLTSGPSVAEKEVVARIVKGCLRPKHVVSLAGRLTLPELAEFIRRARLFVGVDSAPMHMAAASGTPSVVLFGPSNVRQWKPWQAPHTLIWAGDYRNIPAPEEVDTGTAERYLSSIPAEDVIAAVERHLNLTRISAV